MKIGILTYHRAHNYGALLQAFALKTWLEKEGHDVEFIDYWPQYHSAEYQLLPHFKTQSFKGKIKSIIYLILGFKKLIKRRNCYEKFIFQHLELPPKPSFTKKEEIINTRCFYDIVIYGSDQIWRKQNYPLFKGFDEVYFGSFINTQKKISYAASMGDIKLDSATDYNFLKSHLNQFDKISVREQDSQKLITKLLNKNTELVLDPVFLLHKNQWINFIPKQRRGRNKYILLYQLRQSKESVELTKMIKNEYNYNIIEISGRFNPFKVGDKYKQTLNPFEFLGLVQNAEIVVTTSFHGTAFSIIFEKQFYALGMGNKAERAKTLLRLLGISNHYLENIESVDFSQKIDYKIVMNKLQENISQSVAFLRNTLYLYE